MWDRWLHGVGEKNLICVPTVADLCQHDVVELGVGKKCVQLVLGSSGKPVAHCCSGHFLFSRIHKAYITMKGLRENLYSLSYNN